MPKKRSSGEGGLYELKGRGLWRGVVDVGFWPDGRRRQKTVTAKTQAEARRKLRALQSEIAEYGTPLDKSTTVEAWATHWLATVCRPTMKPHGLSTYTSMVNVWIIPTIGKKRIAQLRPSDVRQVTQAITAAGRESSTAQKAHTVLSSMLESARLDGLIARNVAGDVVPPKAGESNRAALSTETALALLEHAAHHVDGTRWWVALLAGMRQGERLGATIDSIDFDNHVFHVKWSLTEAKFEHGCGGTCPYKRGGSCPQRRLILADGLKHRVISGRLILVTPKSGKERTFPLIPQLEEALRRYLAATANVPNPHGLIWRNADGSPLTAKQENDDWRDLLYQAGAISAEQAKRPKERAEGTELTPTGHWARHTTATVLMELGVDPKVIGEIVGHVNVSTTQRYQHVSSAAAQAAMSALGDHFSRALNS